MSVIARRKPLSIPTYGLGEPEKNPLFFERRVYQGSSGKVYPVPFIDKVFDAPENQWYDSVHLENDYVRLVMLPEIGGRIFQAQDKVNQDYDFFYRQDEIKPALVGLAGPWISGGVEFNWPQHHRPGTYMPADVHMQEEADGGHTVWLSEHDPIDRLKGMHGIRLQPDSALVEVKVRLYNRTGMTQTFLWWANVCAEVHDQYQSFFPPDVHYVADHAVRAQSSFPVSDTDYYGVNYANRPGANDISWYKNIPVPTSYMVCDTNFGFFGGYDYLAGGGFVHVANRHLSPGKKQWTWGNHEFGWAWDRELTDRCGPTGRAAPYVELMAGVYTDNQPDFSYLLPYETKTFSQYWWPYQKIGPVQNATKDAAVRLVQNDDGTLDLGAVASRRISNARIMLRDLEAGNLLLDECVELSPDKPWHCEAFKFDGSSIESLQIAVEGLVAYQPVDTSGMERNRGVATEPPRPEEIDSNDTLHLTAEHLEQCRHATCDPEAYWQEALRRDPEDTRVNIALGRRKLKQGLFEEAQTFFEVATGRLTHKHPNPYTGEAHYYLGLALRSRGARPRAYRAFYKAIWNYEWRSAAYYELAMLDCWLGDYEQAIEHCRLSLETNQNHNKAVVVQALAMRSLGQDPSTLLKTLLEQDPLEHWARWVLGDTKGFAGKTRNNAQIVLDVAYDLADAGFIGKAADLLVWHHDHAVSPVAVPNPLEVSQLTHYALAWLKNDLDLLAKARAMSPDYCFPSRLHDQVVLEWAIAQDGPDRNAAFGLGNYLFNVRRHEDAIAAWEQARSADPAFATVHRNLGIAYWNTKQDGEAARGAYEKAVACDGSDPRLVAEFDQLCQKLGDAPIDRLDFLLARSSLVYQRDDCSVALAALYNETGQPQKALDYLLGRRFHPWEGGEGQVLRQYTAARLLLGQEALNAKNGSLALEHFQMSMEPPQNLGEAYHLLQAKADVNYWLGCAHQMLGEHAKAARCFEESAGETGDFEAMVVIEHSESSYYRGLSLIELGCLEQAESLFGELKTYAMLKLDEPQEIDYFATSLPLLLVLEDVLDKASQEKMQELIYLADQGLQRLMVDNGLPVSSLLRLRN